MTASKSAVLTLLSNVFVVREATGLAPSQGSPGENDRDTCGRPQSADTLRSQASAILESAADHLEALDELVSRRQYAAAPWSCARVLFEACGLVLWLLDSDATTDQRIGRSLSLRMQTQDRQRKMANSVGDTRALSNIESRLDKIATIAETRGFVNEKQV